MWCDPCDTTAAPLIKRLPHHIKIVWCDVLNVSYERKINVKKIGMWRTNLKSFSKWWAISCKFLLITCVQISKYFRRFQPRGNKCRSKGVSAKIFCRQYGSNVRRCKLGQTSSLREWDEHNKGKTILVLHCLAVRIWAAVTLYKTC